MKCHFCSDIEDTNHLFFNCKQVQKIWFWLGKSQDFFYTWNSIIDIFDFAAQFSGVKQKNFLIILSTICWTLWRYRNEICFQSSTNKSIRAIILLIIYVFEYWVGHMDIRIRETAEEWLLEELNAISLRMWDPTNNQLVLYQGNTSEEETGQRLLLKSEAGSPIGWSLKKAINFCKDRVFEYVKYPSPT